MYKAPRARFSSLCVYVNPLEWGGGVDAILNLQVQSLRLKR